MKKKAEAIIKEIKDDILKKRDINYNISFIVLHLIIYIILFQLKV